MRNKRIWKLLSLIYGETEYIPLLFLGRGRNRCKQGQLDWDIGHWVWPQGGLNGLAWDGRYINLMPRSLRWHSLWHKYRYYLYGMSIVYGIVGLIAIGCLLVEL